MPEQVEKACSRHRSPYPCKVNNDECKIETNKVLVQALLDVYRKFGIER